MLYWRYWFSVTQTLNCNCIWRSVTYIPWSSALALYLDDNLMDKCHNGNIGSMWCKDLPHKMYVGQWPTFYGWMILSCLEDLLMQECCTEDIDSVRHWPTNIYVGQWPIFLVQWLCLIFSILLDEQASFLGYWLWYRHWPVFHALVILNHLPISAYSGLLKFDMKIFMNVVRLEIGPVVYSRREPRASVYFGHISSCNSLYWRKSRFLFYLILSYPILSLK